MNTKRPPTAASTIRELEKEQIAIHNDCIRILTNDFENAAGCMQQAFKSHFLRTAYKSAYSDICWLMANKTTEDVQEYLQETIRMMESKLLCNPIIKQSASQMENLKHQWELEATQEVRKNFKKALTLITNKKVC